MMIKANEIYEKYDLLLPPKFEGGYLIIALYNKIKNEELAKQFTITDIRNTLDEIKRKYGEHVPQSERILKILLHYHIRNSSDEPGKYYLTERACNLVEFLTNILDNPLKNFPLKDSFEKFFVVIPNEIQNISDLERKFGRLFIEGPKKIINDHLEALEDELNENYAELNKILQSDEESATLLVNKFTIVFQKFGERAKDITNSITTKDKFMKDLYLVVEQFHTELNEFKHPETHDEYKTLDQLNEDVQAANAIYRDLETFFESIDEKIKNIRRYIHNASDKLNELHEQFTARMHMRLQIKRLLKITLDNASYSNKDITLNKNFPLKNIVQQKIDFLYPGHYDFELPQPNIIIRAPEDDHYYQKELQKINDENERQETINSWVQKAKALIKNQKTLDLKMFMEEIVATETDVTLAYQVASEIKQEILNNIDNHISIEKELVTIKNTELSLWKTNILKK